MGTDAIFMDDIARPHRAQLVWSYLENETIPQMVWLARSPDLNPIEQVWDMLGGRIVLYDGKLSSAIVFMYNPVATDSQLCLQAAPKGNVSFFVHTPHALMLQDVKAITTYSIHSTLNSIGGIQVLFPLLGQLDIPTGISQPKSQEKKLTTCATLIGFVCDLVENSPTVQQHMIQNKAFLVISYLLQKASRDHITEEVLLSFLNLTKYLVTVNNSNSELLLKQLLDHILFNPALWIYTPTVVQTKLFTYLATDFLADTQIYSNVRRISTVLQTMHTLKYYYWVVNPRNKSGITPKGIDGPRPCQNDIMSIRAYILLFLKQLILKGNGVKEDELQSILNYLTTVHEDENLHDVLQMLMSLMSEHPASMVPAFDIKNGISNDLDSRTIPEFNQHLSAPLQHFEFPIPLDQQFPNWDTEAVPQKLEKELYMTVFKLLASTNEVIRLQALKLLGYFLSRSTHKRKHDVMGPHNLYMLLADRLLLHSDHISLSTYNVLYEILTEHVSSQILYQKHPEPESHYRLENPMILKVIATLIRQSKHCEELMETKKLFLSDMTLLCNNNKENRRTVLQMSVWQEWLIAMAYIHPQNAEEQKLSDMVYSLFRMLLHHAIKYEYGGWRVWVDTLAIVHSKVSFEEFKLQFSQMYEQYEQRRSDHLTDPALRKQKPISTISGLENNNHRALNVVNPPRPDIIHKDSNENSKPDTVKAITDTPSSHGKETDSIQEETNKASSSSPGTFTASSDESREKTAAVQVPEVQNGMNKPNYNSSLCEALLTADDHRPVPVESVDRSMIEALPVQTLTDDEACSIDQATSVEENSDLHLSHTQEIDLESDSGAKIGTDNPQTNSPSDSGLSSLSVNDDSKGKTLADDELTYENELALDDESAATEKSPDEIPNEILDDDQPVKSFEDMEHISYESSTFSETVEDNTEIRTSDLQDFEDKISQIPSDSHTLENDSKETYVKDTETNSSDSQTSTDVSGEVTEPSEISKASSSSLSAVPENEENKSDTIAQETTESSADNSIVAAAGNDTAEDESSDAVTSSESHTLPEIGTSEVENIQVDKDELHQENEVNENQDSVQINPESQILSNSDTTEEESCMPSRLSEKNPKVSTDPDTSEVVSEIKPESNVASPSKQNLDSSSVTDEKEENDSSGTIKIAAPVVSEQSITEDVNIVEVEKTVHEKEDSKSLPHSPEKALQTASSLPASPTAVSSISQVGSPASTDDKDANVYESKPSEESSPFKQREDEEEETEKLTGISTIEGQLEKERRLMAEASGDRTDEQILNETASTSPKTGSETASWVLEDSPLGDSPLEKSPVDPNTVKNSENVTSSNQNVVSVSEIDVAPTRRTRSVIVPRKQPTNQVQRPKSMSMSQKPAGGNGRQMFNSGPTRPPFRIPEFRWSPIHQRLLSDLLFSLETDIQVWRSHTTKTVIDFVNSGENAIFVINTVHLISQVADNIIIACGGLLPLLASATSPNHELDVIEPTQGMSIEVAVAFLQRLVNMTDVLVFASSLSFSELEAEKNMSSGGILRQCLRLVCTSAVRNCLECRERSLPQTPVIPHPSSSMSRDSRPSPIQALIGGVQPSAKNIVENLGGQSSPIRDPEKLLQDMDVNRLRAVIYRDVDETKQAQFLALAVVYFISVLMVSKYRDILEPPPPPSSFSSRQATNSEMSHYTSSVAVSSSASQTVVDSDARANGQLTDSAPACNEDGEDEVIIVEDTDSSILAHLHSSGAPVSAVIRTQKLKAEHGIRQEAELMVNGAGEDSPRINEELRERDMESESVVNLTSVPEAFSVADTRVSNSDPSIMTSSLAQNGYSRTLDSVDGCQQSRTDDIHISSLGSADDFHMLSSSLSREATLTQKLESALGSVCPLLREIMLDFAPFLSRTLVGSHGQDLLVEGKGLCTFKNSTSVVELVMLLCSQEWQNSLQKHAGLAFIELINEGRLLSHAMKDHIVRVANEAEFILNRMRADDVLKHADFESLCAQTVLDRKEEEKMCDHLITAARRRDSVTASRNIEKILNILTNKHGAWGNKISTPQREFLKLDSWEDDARRRKRFVQNPYGSSHPEATLKAAIEHGAPEDAILQAREEFHQHLALTRRQQQHHLQSSDLLDDSDLWDDKDLDAELAGPVSFSTKCRLVAPGVVVPGMLSITQAEMFFEVDEDDPEYKKMDPEVGKIIFSIKLSQQFIMFEIDVSESKVLWGYFNS
ncbi:Neurobeachin [Araneus ventricosus]|uniref:Neurobeachin n=1 Tax=Araneus ventricosus TaxID=182803 RepID=A0A4Y2E8P8_ARAVE|nr:Neurobeachin [Araneus ventricosus]